MSNQPCALDGDMGETHTHEDGRVGKGSLERCQTVGATHAGGGTPQPHPDDALALVDRIESLEATVLRQQNLLDAVKKLAELWDDAFEPAGESLLQVLNQPNRRSTT